MDNTSTLTTVHVRYSGRVQGVGFRYTVQAMAAEQGLSGWVRNLPDGGVEMRAQGPRERVSALLKAIRSGMLGRGIEDEQISWEQRAPLEQGFEIRYR
ncbi:MAG: acylphosphatase [Candidatus Omnitrophica bacterium]|nr:acylphosphatase [Candidatus Omnitrophota bacterium]